MSLEMPRPRKEKQSLTQRISDLINKIRGVEEPNEREFFNADRSRKWVFYKWKWGEDGESGQLNAALCVRVGDGWASLMKGMMRWEPGMDTEYGLEISGVNANRNESIYWYDASTGGKKRWSGMQIMYSSQNVSQDEIVAILYKSGVRNEIDLPEFVDFASTITLFMNQAKNLDFSNPQIVEKKLVR